MKAWVGYYGVPRTLLLAVGTTVATVLLTAGFVLYALPTGWVAGVALAVAVVAVAVVLTVPVHVLPAMALLVFAFFPMQLVPGEGVANVSRPVQLVLYVWVLRRWWRRDREEGDSPFLVRTRFGGRLVALLLGVLLVAWLVVTSARSLTPSTSTAWSAGFIISTFVPLLVLDARREAVALRAALLWSGGILGAYCVLEQLVRSSPVFDAVYAAAGASVSSPWAVYRSEASFGHPLFAGAFLTVPAALGISAWVLGSRTRDLVLGSLSAVGVVMTVSRGSILAVGVGLLFTVLAALVLAPRSSPRRVTALVVICAVGLGGLTLFAPLTERAESTESQLSGDVRTQAISVALRVAGQANWLGTGPATSGVSGRTVSDIVIENSLLQLLISVGIPGLLLFLLLFGAASLEALRRRDIAPAAAIVAYLTAITGFNSIDAVRPMHVVLGLLLLLALNDGNRTRTDTPDSVEPRLSPVLR